MGPGPSGADAAENGPPVAGSLRTPAPARERLGEALLAVLLVLGGAAALLHETAWFRMLIPVLGAGALTGAAVSAGALLGLALGAAVGGRAAATATRPLLVLALGEAFAALLCLAMPRGVVGLSDLVRGSGGAGGAGEVTTAVVATLLCAVAAFPMGLSVPAALRALAPPVGSAGAVFRRLYAWNTLGAVGGVLVGAGWLLERLGNRGTVAAAALAQAGVAVAAALLAWGWRRAGRAARAADVPGEAAPSAPPAPRDHSAGGSAPLHPSQNPPTASKVTGPSRAALAAAFLAGGAGLVIQVAWVRRLTPAVGTTTQAFATVLAAYLAALALGSLLLGPRRGGPGGRRGSAWVLALGALPVAWLPVAIAPVARWAAERAASFTGDEGDLLLLRAAAAGFLLVPSVLLGAAALPWLVREEGAAGPEGTRRSGRLLAWNTAGSAAFALLTGLFWLPAVGSAAVLRGAAGLLLGAAALRVPRGVAAALGTVGLALLVQPFVLPVEDAAGRDAVGAAFLPGQFAIEGAPALFYAEGRATTVVVRDREGRRELWMEGKIEASTQPTDLLHLTLLGALPMALHPAPRRAGVIGLGTGRTAKAVAAFAPERLVVFELEPEVVRASALFVDEGAGVPASAEVVLGDARRSLDARTERFDVLTSDPIHPGVAGSALLYSRESYAAVKARLAEGGVFCQWLPMYQLTADDLRLVLRTLAAEFHVTHLFQSGADLVVVAAEHPIRVDEAALRARLVGPAGAPLAPLGLRSPGRLLALHLKDTAGVKRFAGEGPLNTDDRLILEFRAGRAWFRNEQGTNARLLALRRASAEALLSGPPSAAFTAEIALGARHNEAIRRWLNLDREGAIEAFDALAVADPGDRFATRMRDGLRLERLGQWLADGLDAEAAAETDALRTEAGLDDVQRLDLAEALLALGRDAEGRSIAAEVARTRGWPRARRLAAP